MKINVYVATQQLELLDDAGKLLHRYAVSTAANGAGETSGSYCTPRGRHVIRAKIGSGQPENTVFTGRRPTGEIYTPELGMQFPGRDWILTRILWLSGCEVGFNRLGKSDTMRQSRGVDPPVQIRRGERAQRRGCRKTSVFLSRETGISGNFVGRIKGAKCPLDLQFLTWDFS